MLWNVALALALIGSAIVLVRLVRQQRRQTRRLRALAAELERERERTAQLAVVEERTRIARELHEIVARALGGIAARSDDAAAALDSEPERARSALRAIHRSAQEALGEMQRLLGVLRDDAAEPGLDALPALVERARAAGMPVTLHVEGYPLPIPAGLDLSAFWIVQEALANAHRHARGAPATVRVVWAREALSLHVRDVGVNGARTAVNGEGHGLVGMRERVRVHGGELHAVRLPGGGFEVTAVLPL